MKRLLFIILAVLLTCGTVFGASPVELRRDSGGIGNVIQGFAPSSISNYYLTKSVSFPLTSVLVFKVQTDQDTKMYLGSDATNYFTIYSGTSETFVSNAAQAVFSITSSAKTSAPNLRILVQ